MTPKERSNTAFNTGQRAESIARALMFAMLGKHDGHELENLRAWQDKTSDKAGVVRCNTCKVDLTVTVCSSGEVVA